MKKKLPLHVKIIIGLILGVIWAILSAKFGMSRFTLDWIAPFGTIFINLLKLIAIPLVLFSIIGGVASLSDVTKLGRVGLKTLTIYLVTTVLAVSVGLLLVNLIKPGERVEETSRLENRERYENWVAGKEGVELIDGEAMFNDAAETTSPSGVDKEVSAKIEQAAKNKNQSPLQFLVDIVPENLFMSLSDNRLMLQIIFFAIFFGVTLLFVDANKARPVISFIEGINEVFLKMVDFIMKAAPFFVFALLAGTVANLAGDDIGGLIQIFKGLAWYSLVVLAGLLFMIFVFYPLVARIITRNFSYREFFKAIAPAQMLAFSTSSSAATLPVTMDCVHDNLKVPREISSFVLPIGATVNMDGTSLYQAVAVVFLAQLHMIDLTMGQQITIVLMSTLASIGSAAVPSAGLVMLIIVLQSVGLNPAWIAIILPVDRPLDMCRTVVNVTGDCVVATTIAKTEKQVVLK